MFRKLKLSQRIALALAFLTGLIAATGAAGYFGALAMARSLEQDVSRASRASELALEVRASALQLRRFEKDYCLNMGSLNA